ncbi:hypothetical protein KBB05_00215 [Patescibacteria group bacterium]|nr:hypothetical protein [Patescibacteria group bacterium]
MIDFKNTIIIMTSNI